MALLLTLVAIIAVSLRWHVDPEAPQGIALRLVFALVNIWVTAGIIHVVLISRTRLLRQNAQLEEFNAELEARNEELAAHEEEIARQNEELQNQTEELEQQTEELSQQTEELTQQADDLQHSNHELSRREQALQSLLSSTRWMKGRDFAEAGAAICQAAVQALGDPASAACIADRDGDQLVVRSHFGFGPLGPVRPSWRFDRSFGAIIMNTGRTAYLRDVALRPDLDFAHPAEGEKFSSLIAAPVGLRDRPRGVIKVYSLNAHDWTEEQFSIMDWFATQAATLLELMELQKELDARRRDAEQASIRKTRFLAAVSHDIRTPVNAITLLAEVVQRQATNHPDLGDLRHLTRELRHNAHALVELVSDVLDIAHFDSGKLDLQLSRFPLDDALRREVRQLEPLAVAKGLALRIECPETIFLHVDRPKLGRALSNLIGNAIKFTESGEVVVASRRAAGGAVEISVRDSGVGISPEHVAQIFDEFTQLRNPERDRSKGAGLGLAICRRLLEALGGQLKVVSTLGVGSTFTITLPETVVVMPANEDVSCERPHQSVAGLKILLVEDHESTRRALSRLLGAEGAEILEAATGQQALDTLAHDSPDVLLLDLMLPDMDGRDVLKSLAVTRPTQLRCALVVSGDVSPERIEEVRRLGADGMIPKPIELTNLLDVMTSQLKNVLVNGR
jgi:signal transduction histidine kinase/ActR/RegA family two-component response regulator